MCNFGYFEFNFCNFPDSDFYFSDGFARRSLNNAMNSVIDNSRSNADRVSATLAFDQLLANALNGSHVITIHATPTPATAAVVQTANEEIPNFSNLSLSTTNPTLPTNNDTEMSEAVPSTPRASEDD